MGAVLFWIEPMSQEETLDKFESLFGVRPEQSSPKTWLVKGRHFRWWHIVDLIEQKEREVIP